MSNFEVLPVPPDVRVFNHGSLWQFFLLTEEARNWTREYVQTEFSDRGHFSHFYCEPRYAVEIVEGMRGSGLEVTG